MNFLKTVGLILAVSFLVSCNNETETIYVEEQTPPLKPALLSPSAVNYFSRTDFPNSLMYRKMAQGIQSYAWVNTGAPDVTLPREDEPIDKWTIEFRSVDGSLSTSIDFPDELNEVSNKSANFNGAADLEGNFYFLIDLKPETPIEGTQNSWILKYDSSGNLLTSSPIGQIYPDSPSTYLNGIRFYNDKIYVQAEKGHHIFDSELNPIGNFGYGSDSTCGFAGIVGQDFNSLRFDSKGRMYVFLKERDDPVHYRFVRYSPEGDLDSKYNPLMGDTSFFTNFFLDSKDFQYKGRSAKVEDGYIFRILGVSDDTLLYQFVYDEKFKHSVFIVDIHQFATGDYLVIASYQEKLLLITFNSRWEKRAMRYFHKAQMLHPLGVREKKDGSLVISLLTKAVREDEIGNNDWNTAAFLTISSDWVTNYRDTDGKNAARVLVEE